MREFLGKKSDNILYGITPEMFVEIHEEIQAILYVVILKGISYRMP